MANYTWPSVSVASAPIQFVQDGSNTTVMQDTGTPVASKPLPVIPLDSSGNPIPPFDPSTIEGYLQTIAGDTTAIEADVATLAAVDYATETTLSSLESKDFATLTEQQTQSTTLSNISSQQLGFYNSANSSTTPLGAAGVFTGTGIDITNYAAVSIAVATDVNSAVSGLAVQFSPDNINWDHTAHSFDVTAPGLSYNLPVELRYMRIVYTNNVTPQSYFRLTTILKRTYVPPSVYTLSQGIYDSTVASPVKSVIYGKTTAGGGSYVAVKVNPSGALTADVTGTVAATQSGTWNINNVSGTVSLPTNAATESTLSGLNTKVVTTANGIKVDGSAVTQPISAASLPLPSGASTLGEQQTQSTTLSAISGKLPATLGQTTKSGSLSVTVASDQIVDFKAQGRTKVGQLFNDYASSNVTTAAYVQLTASTSATVSRIEIFDSSGETMILAVGGAGSEVDQLYIFPGGNGSVDLAIPASSRISIKGKTGTASEGYLAINLYA